MKKIVILLSVMLFMVACEKGNEEMKEAKVVVAVYDENGKIATGDRKSTRLNSSHNVISRMSSSA